MDAVPVRVHQLLASDRAGYLLRCPRTRAAALVDPSPEVQPAFEALVEQHDLKVRFVLRTGLGPLSEPSRYGRMLADLGLGPAMAEAPEGPDPFEDISLVGPAAPRDGAPRAAPEAMLLQAGEGTVGVRLFDGSPPPQPRFTVGGSLLGGPPPTAHICGSARVALGAFFVEVLPLGEGRVAYLAQDRLFTGRPPGKAEPALLHLPADTIVYPSRVEGAVGISTVGQERRANPEAAERGEAAEWPG